MATENLHETDGLETTTTIESPMSTEHTHTTPDIDLGAPHKSGPGIFALLLGGLGLLVAALLLTVEVADISINTEDAGPTVAISIGAVIVLGGLIGLLASRRRQ